MAPEPCKACLGHVYFQLRPRPDIVRSLQNRCSLKFRFSFQSFVRLQHFACLHSYRKLEEKTFKLDIVNWLLPFTIHKVNCWVQGLPDTLTSCNSYPSDFRFAQVHSEKWAWKIPTGWLIPSHLPPSLPNTHPPKFSNIYWPLSTGLRCYAHSNIFGIRSPHSPWNSSWS